MPQSQGKILPRENHEGVGFRVEGDLAATIYIYRDYISYIPGSTVFWGTRELFRISCTHRRTPTRPKQAQKSLDERPFLVAACSGGDGV